LPLSARAAGVIVRAIERGERNMADKTTFVLIHGAWGGGWNYQRVARALRAERT
jgi:hypothetical protein